MNNFETEREKFKPTNITILFVAESRPNGGTFFYFRNSNLYNAIFTSFKNVYSDINNSNFLDKFKDKGCYLEDLCTDPVNKLGDYERTKAKIAGIPILADKLKEFKPKVIVTLMKAISPYIDEAIKTADIPLDFQTSTSFPIRSRENIDKCIHDVEFVLNKYLTPSWKDMNRGNRT